MGVLERYGAKHIEGCDRRLKRSALGLKPAGRKSFAPLMADCRMDARNAVSLENNLQNSVPSRYRRLSLKTYLTSINLNISSAKTRVPGRPAWYPLAHPPTRFKLDLR